MSGAASGAVPLQSWVALPLLLFGALFFVAGTVGLLRFPDAHARLHALSKADNVGLGLVVAGLAIESGQPLVGLKLGLIWLLALLGSSAGAYQIARSALRGGRRAGDSRPVGADEA